MKIAKEVFFSKKGRFLSNSAGNRCIIVKCKILEFMEAKVWNGR